ncbi:hypothetical protein [Mycobacteroides abscessus]
MSSAPVPTAADPRGLPVCSAPPIGFCKPPQISLQRRAFGQWG